MNRTIFRKLLMAVPSAALLLSAAVSCRENGIDSQPLAPPKMDVSAMAEYTVQAKSPEVIRFSISSNTPWKISSDSQWCVPDPAMSSASSLVADISVTCGEYDGDAARTAVLSVSGEGVETVNIKVHQSAQGRLDVKPAVEMIPSSGGSVTFAVRSNMAWTATSNAIWLSLDRTSGEPSAEEVTVTATASGNMAEFRTASVTVSAEGMTPFTFEISQDGALFNVSETALRARWNDASVSFTVETNLDWELMKDDGSVAWYSFERQEGSGKTEIKVLLDEFSDADATVARKAGFVIMAKGNSRIRREISLSQAYNPTSRHEFAVEGQGQWFSDGVTWSRRWADGVDGQANNKLVLESDETGNGYAKFTWKSQIQKKLPLRGTYSFKVDSYSGLGMPMLVLFLSDQSNNWGDYEMDFYVNVSKKTHQTVLKSKKGVVLNETKPFEVPGEFVMSMGFDETADGCVKATWFIDGREIASMAADGSDNAPKINYGSDMTFYVGNNGNPTQYYGWTRYDWWEYTVPEDSINWGE